jgi:hypothetical protein
MPPLPLKAEEEAADECGSEDAALPGLTQHREIDGERHKFRARSTPRRQGKGTHMHTHESWPTSGQSTAEGLARFAPPTAQYRAVLAARATLPKSRRRGVRLRCAVF